MSKKNVKEELNEKHNYTRNIETKLETTNMSKIINNSHKNEILKNTKYIKLS